MLKNKALLLFVMVASFSYFLKADTMQHNTLTLKQQSTITIAAFTANGDLDKLKNALVSGLNVGLNVNEIKEICVHLYAYTGFPRSLNALNTFSTLLSERQAQGIYDTIGEEATPLPANFNKNEYGAHTRAELMGQKEILSPKGYQLFAPIIDTFLKEHLFADIFVRDVLDHPTRELVTISALASMRGVDPQLQAHLAICLHVGWSKSQLENFIDVLDKNVGNQEAKNAHDVFINVLTTHQ